VNAGSATGAGAAVICIEFDVSFGAVVSSPASFLSPLQDKKIQTAEIVIAVVKILLIFFILFIFI
jgi:hypothetical protein